MEKITVVVSCPIDTYSGYGARSRDFVKALLKTEKYDVKVLSQRWGSTRFGYLAAHNEVELASLIIPQLTSKPNVWVQITIPNEFQAIGEYNIGVTAGIETDLAHASWIEGCNRMNLVLASSNHAKKVFEESKFQVENNGQITGSIYLKTPVEVLFEGVDLSTYLPKTYNNSSSLTQELNSIRDSFCFLFVGHWLQGDFGQDRKNVGYMIKSFLETFKNKKNPPALILKTQGATSSILDRQVLLDKIDQIKDTVVGPYVPNVYLLHGDLTDEEVNELYNHPKVKAMVSCTKGEGFGRPLLEFSVINKPIIASGWSGHIDYLDPEFTTLLSGTLTPVHNSAVVKDTILAEAKWFTPNDSAVATAYKNIFDKYKNYTELSKRQGYKSRNNFSFDNMVEQLDSILSQSLPTFAKQVELKLPTLNLPKLQKLQ